jgi:hypothetical protein
MGTLKLKSSDEIFQLRISLLGSEPEIWRTIQISADASLSRLHKAIQSAFDWEDSHLHEFTTIKHEKINKKQKLKEVLRVGKKIIYTYDFGDCWEHLIIVESRQSPDSEKKYPCCIDGKNHAPFEDIGGIFGYLDILDALQDPDHPSYEDYMQIVEDETGTREFDPTKFNLNDIKF